MGHTYTINTSSNYNYCNIVIFIIKIKFVSSQIDVVNEAFTPSSDEVEEARELLALFEEKQAEGLMAFSFKGQMVDVPHLTRARKIVEMAENLSDLE